MSESALKLWNSRMVAIGAGWNPNITPPADALHDLLLDAPIELSIADEKELEATVEVLKTLHLLPKEAGAKDTLSFLRKQDTTFDVDVFDDAFAKAIAIFSELNVEATESQDKKQEIMNALQEKREELCNELEPCHWLPMVSTFARGNHDLHNLLLDLAYGLHKRATTQIIDVVPVVHARAYP